MVANKKLYCKLSTVSRRAAGNRARVRAVFGGELVGESYDMTDEQKRDEEAADVRAGEAGRGRRKGAWISDDALGRQRRRREIERKIEAKDRRGLITALYAYGLKDSDELFQKLLALVPPSPVVRPGRGRKP